MNRRLSSVFSSIVNNFIERLCWLTSRADKSSEVAFRLHLLVVKNSQYASLARICLESFFYYHPKSTAIIHCDSLTRKAVFRNLLPLRIRHGNRVIIESFDDTKNWQQRKLELILSLSGSQDIFMDADLKWNGALCHSFDAKLTYFVNEGSSKYLDVLPYIKPTILTQGNISMKNTSFFCWGGVPLAFKDKVKVNSYHEQILTLSNEHDLHNLNEIKRVSEQIALALIPDIFSLPYGFLKVSDKQFDGSLVESSYFGASGGRFALWGNTNRPRFSI